jgi:hypothetical protein
VILFFWLFPPLLLTKGGPSYILGASLILYQLIIYRWVHRILGTVNSSRIASVSSPSLTVPCRKNIMSSSSLSLFFNFDIAGCVYTCSCYISLHDIPTWGETLFCSLFCSRDEKCSCSKSFHNLYL